MVSVYGYEAAKGGRKEFRLLHARVALPNLLSGETKEEAISRKKQKVREVKQQLAEECKLLDSETIEDASERVRRFIATHDVFNGN